MAAQVPDKLTIRTYDVGFGDCFLLTFGYPSRQRSILIDFGSMSLPRKAQRGYMEKVAKQIALDCGGRLEAVVATHRHQDHISGFSIDQRGKGPGAVIRSLRPRLVVQPWTEDPRAPRNAKSPADRRRRVHLQTLETMHDVAQWVADSARSLGGGQDLARMRSQLAVIGMDNIRNEAAVRNLHSMAPKCKFVHFGGKSGLESLLPGVKVSVLGPPTVKQTDTILRQRGADPDEFWHLNAAFWRRTSLTAGLSRQKGGVLFPRYALKTIPRSARWYQYYARREHAESLLSIVRILDNAMNNTSVILLFEVNDKLFLFPGDAQYENWMYALNQPAVLEKLARVDVYKVGHHGSLNATPRTLWNNFTKRSEREGQTRLLTLLSTKDNVHGEVERRTEVPRRTLVSELKRRSTLVSTREFKDSELSRATEITL